MCGKPELDDGSGSTISRDIEQSIADIPDFTKLLVALLSQLGVPVIVCALIALAFTLESYVTPARLAFKGGEGPAA